MLDAIFQFTDFEAFHGTDLDTDIVIAHRNQSRQTETEKPLISVVVQSDAKTGTASSRPRSKGPSSKQSETPLGYSKPHVAKSNKKGTISRTEQSPDKKDYQSQQNQVARYADHVPSQQSIKSEVSSKSYFNKPSRGSVISSEAETLSKRRLSADPRRERSQKDSSNGDSLSNQKSTLTKASNILQSKNGGAGGGAAGQNSRFVDQQKVYKSLQQLPKTASTGQPPAGAVGGQKSDESPQVITKQKAIGAGGVGATSQDQQLSQPYQVNAAQFYHRHATKQQQQQQSITTSSSAKQPNKNGHPIPGHPQAQGHIQQTQLATAGGIKTNQVASIPILPAAHGASQQHPPAQPFNVNIQQLINEYKHKLGQAIRKEDKEVIMKNIMAYQQLMSNGAGGGGGRAGQVANYAQPILTPNQVNQLGFLGVQQNGLLPTAATHHQVKQSATPGSGPIQKRKGSTRHSDPNNNNQGRQQLVGSFVGGQQGSPVVAMIPPHGNATQNAKKSKSLTNQAKQQRLNSNQGASGSTLGGSNKVNTHQQMRQPSARHRQQQQQSKKSQNTSALSSHPNNQSNSLSSQQQQQQAHNRSHQQLGSYPAHQSQSSQQRLVLQQQVPNMQSHSRNLHMPQIGASSGGANPVVGQFKTVQNAYQGVGSNSMSNLHLNGNTKFMTNNYNTSTPSSNVRSHQQQQSSHQPKGLRPTGHHSSSQAALTTQPSTPSYTNSLAANNLVSKSQQSRLLKAGTSQKKQPSGGNNYHSGSNGYHPNGGNP